MFKLVNGSYTVVFTISTLTIILASNIAHAEMYKWRDARGVVQYSNTVPANITEFTKATQDEDGNWATCTASLAEQDGQTLLVATGGIPETTVTILVKVLDDSNLIEESVGCP
jgi:hypothetical protein